MTIQIFQKAKASSTNISSIRSKRLGALLFIGCMAVHVSPASAATSCPTISNNSTTAQTITGTACTVNTGITLDVTGNTAGITMTGGTSILPATLINNGAITQSGTGRAIQSSGTNSVLVIQNNAGATISTANNDTVAAGTGSTTVTSVLLTNAGTILSSAGGQAVNFNKIINGATNSVVNSGLIKAIGSDAVRPGLNGTVNNSGTILSIQVSGSGSDGIDVVNNSGVVVTNTAGGLIQGGRHGITGGLTTSVANAATTSFTTSITNNFGAIIQGDNGSGINLDGLNALHTATIANGGTISGNGVTGDGDGIDVDGVVNIINTGIIRSINAFNAPGTGLAYSEGITVGGGTIMNSGTIEGLVAAGNTNAVGRGITLAGNDITTGPLAGTREAIYGNAVITNQFGGLIRGQSDSGIAVDGAASGLFTVTIHNNAGATIQGGGTSNAAIRTGADNDTINNAGAVNGASSGKAIDLGGGNNALNILGGAASVFGDINGGSGGTNTMKVDPGVGNLFAYSGSISNFNSVEILSGVVTLSGSSTYAGTTVLTGGTLMLDGANRLSSSSALNLNGGTLKLVNAGVSGQTFASLSLTDNSSIDLSLMNSLSFSNLGVIGTGKTLTLTNWSAGASPGYAFRLVGDDTGNTDFLRLVSGTTVNGLAVAFSFDGTYTNVSAVPVPAALWMLISGLGALGAVIRRRQALA